MGKQKGDLKTDSLNIKVITGAKQKVGPFLQLQVKKSKLEMTRIVFKKTEGNKNGKSLLAGKYFCTKIYLCINSDLMIMLYFCAYCCVVGVGVCETGNGK